MIAWMRTLTVMLMLLPGWGQAQEPLSAAASLVGVWYGEGYQPRLKQEMAWVVDRQGDGTYVFDLRRYQDCKLVHKQIEKGRWQQTGMRYSVIKEMINDTSVDDIDEYIIEQITDSDIRYQHVETGTRFHMRRISPTIGFPLPSRCSI